MAQFDVYRNTDPKDSSSVPYLLDIQHDFLSGLRTRVIVPLLFADNFGPPISRLNPVFDIEGVAVVMLTQELAGIGIELSGEPVCSLSAQRDEIISALDLMFVGF